MTNKEFSEEFDILFNNIMSNQAPGLDDYEKSVFLTTAQEQLVIQLYSGKYNFTNSLEQTEELSQYLGNLLLTAESVSLTDVDFAENILPLNGKFKNSIVTLNDVHTSQMWYIVYEAVTSTKIVCEYPEYSIVVPTTADTLYRLLKNPFKRPNSKRVFRLYSEMPTTHEPGLNIELIYDKDYSIDKYKVRYLKRPQPIILQNLPEGLSINDKTTESKCELHTALHREILNKAVLLAGQSFMDKNIQQK